MIWFGWVLWHMNYCWLFNAKSSLIHIYIEYIWFGLVGFYGISIIVGYLMQNLLYTYIYWIHMSLVWLGFMAYQLLLVILMQNLLYTYIYWIHMIWFGWVLWHINYCWLFNAKSSLYIYILNTYDLVWLGFMAYQLLLVI